MKVLFIYKYCILGGVTTQLVNRLRGLQNYWEVHFLFLYDYGGLSAFGSYPYKYISREKTFFKSILNQHNYDVIAVIDTNEVYEWLNEYKGLVITEVHTTTENINGLHELSTKMPMHLIITPSQYMKDLIENKYNFKDKVPVEVVHNCINPELFTSSFKKSLNSGESIILWIGKLDSHKRWFDFIEICRKLEYDYKVKNLRYMLVGGVTAKDQIVNQLIEQLVEKKLVHKMTWYSVVEYEKMKEIYEEVYSTGGVYVSTTINESFGMTVLEAMCMQIPIVVPEVGALKEICEPYKDKTLYPLYDLDKACQMIIKQLETVPYYETRQYYTENICEKYKKVVEEFLSK